LFSKSYIEISSKIILIIIHQFIITGFYNKTKIITKKDLAKYLNLQPNKHVIQIFS